MTVLFLAGAVAGAGVLMVLRVLAINEVRSYLRNRVLANVEATIASLPRDRQDEWGEEWRAEAATLMPLTAALFARGLRRSAAELGGRRTVLLTTMPVFGRLHACIDWLITVRARWHEGDPPTKGHARRVVLRSGVCLASIAAILEKILGG